MEVIGELISRHEASYARMSIRGIQIMKTLLTAL
jgi:hypothetical protein